jgi:hypothetical protein
MTQTQDQMILEFLLTGCGLTPLQALQWFGCLRLASRINTLRNQGFVIHTMMVKTKSNKHIATYHL